MLEQKYNPQISEDSIYQLWQEQGFNKNKSTNSKPYAIMMPPPNVTGNLHMGHALNYTLQDILVRYHRMQGDDILWQPGTDHAGIATQMLVEKQLLKESCQTKDEIGRNKFTEKIWQWKNKYGDNIVQQQKKLGITPNWDRQAFTLDENMNLAVRKAFVQLHEEGLIYRDRRMVNWDPQLKTAISDLEINNIEIQGKLCFIRYSIFEEKNTDFETRASDFEEKNTEIIIATTRPETLFGDSAIAVSPNDNRYKSLIGKYAVIPFTNRKIPIIADDYCDMEKGSGAVKITPAHDFNDFDVGKRHHLEFITIIDEKGCLLGQEVPKDFLHMDRLEARNLILKKLQENGNLIKIENIIHSVPHGDRSGTVLEPRLTTQWFINVESMAQEALKAVQNGETTIMPSNNNKIYEHWLSNIQPWCISRQLWWGHRIPVWYDETGNIFVASSYDGALKKAQIFHNLNNQELETFTLTQDADVLDTWFSSGLWAFATLGWGQDINYLKRFYPNNCLITGDDILFFWVARMMMLGIYFLKQVPFKSVFLHALILDSNGNKMSKTKGNVIDPLAVIQEYGADALRFTLANITSPNRDIKFSNSLVANGRNFITKLWNTGKFLEMNHIFYDSQLTIDNVQLSFNQWIIREFIITIQKFENSLSEYRFDEAISCLYQFMWGSLCDWYVEFTKIVLLYYSSEQQEETRKTFGWIYGNLLKTLHPVIPFVTEVIWQHFNNQKSYLIHESWCDSKKYDSIINNNDAINFQWIIELITNVRSMRNDVNLSIDARTPLIVYCHNKMHKNVIKQYEQFIKNLARISTIEVFAKEEKTQLVPKCLHRVIEGFDLHLIVDGVLDIEKEKNRLNKELKIIEQEIKTIETKINNPKFINKAPKEIKEKNAFRLQEEIYKQQKITQTLKAF